MENAQQIFEEIMSGKATITWAVYQFPEDPKLVEMHKSGDLLTFLTELSDEDPYHMRALPGVDGVKQYLVMARTNQLPFMEEGVTKKQGEDEMGRALVREQLMVYIDKFPWTQDMITKGLAEAEKANCHSCREKRLLEEVARAVADKEGQAIKAVPVQPTPPAPGDEWGSRPSCIMCTLKHLGQAVVLLQESITGYPSHRWLAAGHMAEAEAEAPSHDLANRIREQRLAVMDDLEYMPDLTGIIQELDIQVRTA